MAKAPEAVLSAETMWATIRRACVSRVAQAERRADIERVTGSCLDVLKRQSDGERIRNHVLEIIRIELRAAPKPNVRDAFEHARALILKDA